MSGNKSPNRNGGSPKSPRSVTWNSNVPEKYSFTMRREFERAKEEADLIEQLRNVGIWGGNERDQLSRVD